MKRLPDVMCLLFSLFWLSQLTPNLYGQQSDLPAGWESLSADDMVIEYQRVMQSETPLSKAQQETVQQRAAELLMDSNTAAQASYRTQNLLHQLASSQLSADQKANLATRLSAATAATADMTFTELMHWKNFERGVQNSETAQKQRDSAAAFAAWVESHGQEDLQESLYQLQFLLKNLNLSSFVQQDSLQKISVSWEGYIEAPRTGKYTFSPSEFDISTEENSYQVQQSMSATVDGTPAFSATAESWNSPRTPISLTAGQRVPIRVQYQYETTTGQFDNVKLPLAILNWEGPGIKKSVVPATVFSRQAAKSSGLQATYQVELASGSFSDLVVEPKIEHVWHAGHNFIGQQGQAQQAIVAELWRRVMAPAYWQNPVEPQDANNALPAPLHYFVQHPSLTSFLTCSQRQQFLTTLLAHPEQLARMTFRQAADVFSCYQYGAEEEAISFLRTFLQQHDAHAEPVLTADYYQDNRQRYRQLTIPIFWQHSDYAETLERDFLELEDGSCCLSVAYILAYGKLQQGKIVEWIELLSEKLANETLTGDRRVNWLIARAMAEEIKKCPSKRHFIGFEKIFAGKEWLDEAALVTETTTASARVAHEYLARHAMFADWQGWASAMRQANEQLAADQKALARLAAWEQQVPALKQQMADTIAQQQAEAERDYVAELERRRQLATGRGDAVTEASYARLLDSLKSQEATSKTP